MKQNKTTPNRQESKQTKYRDPQRTTKAWKFILKTDLLLTGEISLRFPGNVTCSLALFISGAPETNYYIHVRKANMKAFCFPQTLGGKHAFMPSRFVEINNK